jgi:hypothetical protein
VEKVIINIFATIIHQYTLVMKQKVYNLIILDESGSMEAIANEAVSGLNETLQSIALAQKKHQDQEHYITFLTFNSDRINTVFNRKRVESGKEMQWNKFAPDSCTPLYDAMGQSISELRKHVNRNDVVLTTIITDGLENASKEYSGKAIKKMVGSLRKKGWVFVYIGTNQDVDAVADGMGIRSRKSYEYSDEGVKRMYRSVNYCRFKMMDDISKYGRKLVEDEDYDFFESDNSQNNDTDAIDNQAKESKIARSKTAVGFLSKIRKAIIRF